MSPFTIFFGRLVELLGAEAAANLVREFAGATLHFPPVDANPGHDLVHAIALERDISLSAAIRVLRAERGRSIQVDSDHFGFGHVASILGAGYVRPPAESTADPLQTEPHRLLGQATSSSEVLPPDEARPPSRSVPVSQQCATPLESTHLTGPSEIESQVPHLPGP